MKRTFVTVFVVLAAVVFLVLAILLVVRPVSAQERTDRWGYGYGMGSGMGPGMMGGYGPGYGYGMGPGMMGGWDWVDIPSRLPAPKNADWVQKLREILAMEHQSLAQYQADQEKFNVFMPYMMIIPQEEHHIDWITQMFEAYGLKPDGKAAPVKDNKTLTEAYQYSAGLENDLLPRYEWLVKNAGDRTSAQALNTILIQSRWHMVMFEHALRMGQGYGYGPGYGMGRGMRGGYYGYGMGRGYGRRFAPTVKAMDAREAEAMMNDYLKYSRNPNLKLGKIRDAGNSFEAEIRTRNGALVDKILIEKDTGYIRSVY